MDGCVTTTTKEITNLLKIVDRDLMDAKESISDDWRFGIAYNAALKLCTILLYAEGYQPERTLQHYRTIQALPYEDAHAHGASSILHTNGESATSARGGYLRPGRTRRARGQN
ncbi:MAG: hypothetical protein AB1487_02030 [Thermodesulfobacteriota bacterium]